MANLFHFATKELAQDAFLCWVFRHADSEAESSVRTISRKLLDQIIQNYRELNKNDFAAESWDSYTLTIQQQLKNIDILLTFTSKITGGQFQVLIEDKTWSDENRFEQLEHYLAKLKDIHSEMIVIPVFFKTGYVSDKKLNELRNRKIVTVVHRDICTLLKDHIDPQNQILVSWWEYFQETFYLPIQEAIDVPLQNVLGSPAQWRSNRLAKEILFDRITDYIFSGSITGLLTQRNVENKKAGILHEYILYVPEWRRPEREFDIGIYFSWGNDLSLDIKTIPSPYLVEKKMPDIRLSSYRNAQTNVKQKLVLPENWSLSHTYLQIAKLKKREISSLSLKELKSKVLSDLSLVTEKINHALASEI
ncbi:MULTISPECIES: hypothetical protein [unclassified Paenibacillus]|uniref:hypothetical protein n=1 Tax=unclassified Paenibacillus TaxID=185978 RepID=UPI002407650C|nr:MULTISPECIES: hypothetical protein [unclassified Paenibacillus]MDF9842851.1 hypothetical protein [Paenibacillus sp. PastF-2]MDF9849281.1 hypothetical protein [Paenibacillus sp. PastM-2]MDF9856011.1 hypothetical protein [Paenibacillus sp. PastF-1]MDH6481122.1 hypothetical protein [Paenibacillus sp. PastH-2]MDH6508543.1 hypothetical protein [Paenibacillus sp. PastM-3]